MLNHYPASGKIKEGRLPEAAKEIALSEAALGCLGIEAKPGDTLTLPLHISLKNDDRPPFSYTADFILTGILENNYLGYSTGIIDALAGEQTAKVLLPKRYMLYSTDFKTKNTRNFQSTVDDLAENLSLTNDNIQYNWVLLDAMGISYREKEGSGADTGFSFMTAACVLTGALILLAAGLLLGALSAKGRLQESNGAAASPAKSVTLKPGMPV